MSLKACLHEQRRSCDLPQSSLVTSPFKRELNQQEGVLQTRSKVRVLLHGLLEAAPAAAGVSVWFHAEDQISKLVLLSSNGSFAWTQELQCVLPCSAAP